MFHTYDNIKGKPSIDNATRGRRQVNKSLVKHAGYKLVRVRTYRKHSKAGNCTLCTTRPLNVGMPSAVTLSGPNEALRKPSPEALRNARPSYLYTYLLCVTYSTPSGYSGALEGTELTAP